MVNYPGSSRTGGLLLVALVLLLSVMSAANLYLLIDSRNSEPPSQQQEEAPTTSAPPIFVQIGPMTVNLQTEGYGPRLLYVGFSLRVRDEATRDILMTHMPEVHSRLLVLLSAQKTEDLVTDGGKEDLVEDILAMFENPLEESLPPLAIHSVLFTDFIVQ